MEINENSQIKEKPSLRERLADKINVSKEIILNTVLISCIGNRELTLENYKSIVEYTNDCIKIKTNPYTVKISGAGLEIKTINSDLLYITGKIGKIEYT